MTKTRKIVGWVLAGLLTAFLSLSFIGKISDPEVATMMTGWGLGDWVTIIAIGEAVSALLFLLPKTNLFGGFLLSSYMGGAIMIHMSHGESFMVPAIVLVVVWAVVFIRNPRLLKGEA